MSGAPGAVAAVVVGARGGERLARTLASVAWAADRVVLDPAGRLAAASVPPGVRTHTGPMHPSDVATAPWLLLLEEDEVVSPRLVEAIALAVGAAAGPRPYRIPLEIRSFGARLRPRGAPLRLAPRDGARLAVAAGASIELRSTHGRPGRLRVPLHAGRAATLAEAVVDLDADATALAAVLHAGAVRARWVRLALAPLVAGGRVLAGRSVERVPWARWILGVFAGYRALVTHAKLWELEAKRTATPL